MSIGRALARISLFGLASAPVLEAQVGLNSNAAQVALVVRVPTGASMAGVSTVQVIHPRGGLSEGIVTLRFSANTSYRLVVRTTDLDSAVRVWVRSVRGNYAEVKAGSSVTVAHEGQTGGQSERKVSYRMESLDLGVHGPPLRYEVVVDPAI